MGAHTLCAPGNPRARPRHEVAHIFRAHAEAYRKAHVLSPEQREVIWAIENCRTSVLGGHEEVCQDCGWLTEAYNSCRNRHCPKCQALDQARWLEQRKERILPTAIALLAGPLTPQGADIPFNQNWQDLLLALTGANLRLCPCCGSTHVLRILIPARLTRAPPGGLS